MVTLSLEPWGSEEVGRAGVGAAEGEGSEGGAAAEALGAGASGTAVVSFVGLGTGATKRDAMACAR